MIGEVVSLRTKLEPGPLVDLEFLEEGEIPILYAGLVDRVADAGL